MAPRWKGKWSKAKAVADPMCNVVLKLQSSLIQAKAQGILCGCSVLLSEIKEHTYLLGHAYFGQLDPEVDVFQLGLEEAFFLCYSLKCLNIVGEGRCALDDQELWQYMKSKKAAFPEFYKAYSHLRKKNWVVRSGRKYGGDFVAYRHCPDLVHSEYIVLVSSEGDGDANGRLKVWSDIFSQLRVGAGAVKSLLVLSIDKNGDDATFPSCVENYTVEERIISRWDPRQCRDATTFDVKTQAMDKTQRPVPSESIKSRIEIPIQARLSRSSRQGMRTMNSHEMHFKTKSQPNTWNGFNTFLESNPQEGGDGEIYDYENGGFTEQTTCLLKPLPESNIGNHLEAVCACGSCVTLNKTETTDVDKIIGDTYESSSKLQSRYNISEARWNDEMGMAEVTVPKGKIWHNTGVIRGDNKIYCSIYEALFLVKKGALHLLDDTGTRVSMDDLYLKIQDGHNKLSWEEFRVYRQLKDLGYVVGQHGIPWSTMGANSKFEFVSTQPCSNSDGLLDSESEDTSSAIGLFNVMHSDEVRPVFDVYRPSNFKKSFPGDPFFVACFTRSRPPSNGDLEALQRRCGSIPLWFCQVDDESLGFVSFEKGELPIL